MTMSQNVADETETDFRCLECPMGEFCNGVSSACRRWVRGSSSSISIRRNAAVIHSCPTLDGPVERSPIAGRLSHLL